MFEVLIGEMMKSLDTHFQKEADKMNITRHVDNAKYISWISIETYIVHFPLKNVIRNSLLNNFDFLKLKRVTLK
jgi:acyl-ACP thioesterase